MFEHPKKKIINELVGRILADTRGRNEDVVLSYAEASAILWVSCLLNGDNEFWEVRSKACIGGTGRASKGSSVLNGGQNYPDDEHNEKG
jgi:hypothetical protein